MNKSWRLVVAQTPTRATAGRFETMEEIPEDRPVRQDSWGIGRQQPNSRTAICSCVQGGTRALTRALQNDLQQLTHVHVPVPRRPCVYQRYAEEFKSACILNADLVSATDHSRFILSTSISTPEPNRASPGPIQDQEDIPPGHIHGLIRSMLLLLSCHGRRLYILSVVSGSRN